MNGQKMTAQEHKVEISGWDTNENFFVESASLGWEEGDENTIRLHNPVRPGSMIFLRVLEPCEQPVPFPVAFRVRRVSAKMEGHAYEALLRRLWPRPQERTAGPVHIAAPSDSSTTSSETGRKSRKLRLRDGAGVDIPAAHPAAR